MRNDVGAFGISASAETSASENNKRCLRQAQAPPRCLLTNEKVETGRAPSLQQFEF